VGKQQTEETRGQRDNCPSESKHKPESLFAWLAILIGGAVVVLVLDRNFQDNLIPAFAFVVAAFIWILVHLTKYWSKSKGVAEQLSSYSLARSQMAIWFFLIVCSWVFLWLVTGTFNTLTTTVLALMGIGAGTALGAEAQDVGKPSRVEEIDNMIKELEAEEQQGASLTPSEVRDKASLKSELAAELKKDLPRSVDFFDDVLTDADGISFHRFQMFIWTIVLGIIFVTEVCLHLSMPDFNTTMLALLGISSGTYLGFMLKEPHSSQLS
jgi:uncharacterized membrane protein